MSEPQTIGSLFNTCIGVLKLDTGTWYWERFGSHRQLEDYSGLAKRGCLGHSLPTWDVPDLAAFRAGSANSGCTGISKIRSDEFSTDAFTFTTSNGFIWTFLQA